MKGQMKIHSHANSAGFTLIEVMVTVFVLAIGVLGMAGMQASGVKEAQNTYFRTQADVLINDMVDRMRANRPAARDASGTSPYTLTHTGAANGSQAAVPTCSAICTPTEMAGIDLVEWSNAINASRLPNVSVKISSSSASIYLVQMFWNEGRTVGGASCHALSTDNACAQLELVVKI